MAARLGYPVFDADNHLYEPQEALLGSDFPHPEGLAEPIEFLKELGDFGAEGRRHIMGGNPKAWLDGAPPH